MKNYSKRKLLFSLLLGMLLVVLPGSIAMAAGAPAMSNKTIDIMVGKSFDLDILNVNKKAVCQWTTSDKKIATVNKNGVVKGIAKGTAKITCKVKTAGKSYRLTATANVIEPAKSVQIISKSKQVKLGDTVALDYKLTPGTSNDKVTWSSSDEAIAKPDADGKFTANKVGVVNITAETMSGKKETITIAVYDDNTRIITDKDLDKDYKLTLSNQTISNLYIDNSVGSAVITLSNVTLTGTLTLEAGADYIIEAKNSLIAFAGIVNSEGATTADKEIKKPTLFAADKVDIWNVLLRGNSYLKVVDTASIGFVKISPMVNGQYEMDLDGYRGNLEVNYDANAIVRSELSGCTIGTVDITKASGDYFILTSNVDCPSVINTINLKAQIFFCLDVITDTLNIDKSLREADMVIANTVNKLVNNGAFISFSVAEDAYIGEIIDNKNSDGNWGNYDFLNTDMGNFAFTVKVGDRVIEGIQLKDFIKIFSAWTDQSKPFEVPEEKGVTLTALGDNLYEINFDGTILTLRIDLNAGVVTVIGADNVKITDVRIAKEKDDKK